MSVVLEASAPTHETLTLDEIDAAAEHMTRTVARMKARIAELEAENEALRQQQNAAFPVKPTPDANGNVPLAPLGITPEMAARIRAAFASFEEEWNAPGMEDYDDYENVIAAVRAKQAEQDRAANANL